MPAYIIAMVNIKDPQKYQEYAKRAGPANAKHGSRFLVRGGKKTALHNLWMMHAWTADAWQSSWGIFSAENPDLGGKIGDINATPDAASRKQLAGTAVKD